MKSQVIYSYNSTWFGRWGNTEGEEIIISADFSDPKIWPFTIKRYELSEDDDTFEEIKTEVFTKKLPKDVFMRVKKVIEDSAEDLKECPSEIENSVRDGSDDMFVFATDSFSKTICGASILSEGAYEDENGDWGDNYDVYKAVKEIEKVLSASGINMYEA